MSKEFLREIQKLSVRLERFIATEDEFVKELRSCVRQFRVLHNTLTEHTGSLDPTISAELIGLRLKTIHSLSKALTKGSDADHEKSHLLESYGTLLLAAEKAFNNAGALNTC